DLCNLPGTTRLGSELYCILHYPTPRGYQKTPSVFQAALSTHQREGRCNYTHFVFPEGWQDLNLSGQIYSHTVEMTSVANLSGNLQLGASSFEKGLIINVDGPRRLDLSNVVITGPLRIASTTLDLLNLEGCTVDGLVEVQVGSAQLAARGARF